MDLSIIIVSFNTRDLLRECLAAIPAATVGLTTEVLVVDNASRDDSLAMLQTEFPAVTLIANATNTGFARANNQALARSRGRFLLLLNSDAYLAPDSLTSLLAHIETHPRCALVGPRLLNRDGSFQASYADFPSLIGELLLLTTLSRWLLPPTYPSYPEEKSQRARSVDWVPGACMLVRRTAFEHIGGLDESYFMYSEETDWCYRFKRAGWTIDYVPTASVVHWSGQSARKEPDFKRAQLYQSKCLFMQKHYGWPRALIFRQSVLVASAFKCAAAWAATVIGGHGHRTRAAARLRSYRRILAEL